MPGYDQYQRMARQLPTTVKSGALAATWAATANRSTMREGSGVDLMSRQTRTLRRRARRAPRETASARTAGTRPSVQFSVVTRQSVESLLPRSQPLGAPLTAGDRHHNGWLIHAREIRHGHLGGEELGQQTAMWWAPDGRKIAYYRFDEKRVPDYYVALDQTGLQDTIDAEAYPKSGVPNPVVDLFVYDVATRQSTRIDVRDGKPFDDNVVGHYVYRVVWSPDGRELLFFRTNRRQNVMEVTAANPATGICRVILREEWPTGWLNDQPRLVFLPGASDSSGNRSAAGTILSYDLAGRLLTL